MKTIEVELPESVLRLLVEVGQRNADVQRIETMDGELDEIARRLASGEFATRSQLAVLESKIGRAAHVTEQEIKSIAELAGAQRARLYFGN